MIVGNQSLVLLEIRNPFLTAIDKGHHPVK